jgi:hypothetical protein
MSIVAERLVLPRLDRGIRERRFEEAGTAYYPLKYRFDLIGFYVCPVNISTRQTYYSEH